ncbi:hypothetical protein OJF2_24570 [Aquisphaera giovannonii]|uniref:Alpha/beta hydrolase family protein n=1 Tax=Aquisphaera giovannonii TaxID=406548 RepID=A0A5B9W1P8_9BACT|nr:hypothetical protein [Aquisphaera giovannonii]QEH33925.1 hypothetical protein OJF2_24570 [Aquisphaera giovannonii]
MRRAEAALRQGHHLEPKDDDACVDRYYEAAVMGTAAYLSASRDAGAEHPEAIRARDLANEALRDCLRAGQQFGRLDPRSHLTVNTPAGSTVVPIRHGGFVWQAEDFHRVEDPTRLERNPSEHGADAVRPGLGADVAIERDNPRLSTSDRFLPRQAAFNATAVLRPDLDAWLIPGGGRPPVDVLEFHDPLREADVPLPAGRVPLRGNFAAGNRLAHQIQAERGPFGLAGFVFPSMMLSKAAVRILEPYQPGKIPVLFVHGLLDDPFLFNDMMVSLYRTPGFVERYQVWVYRYPTGVTSLRTASILREQLREIEGTFDPEGKDPALRRMVVVAYSMGGLVTRLQITSSGDQLWKEFSNVPLDRLATTEETRDFLRRLFYFEPSPMIRRVVFIATPHLGSPVAGSVVGRLATRLVQPASDTSASMEQIRRDNPGAIRGAYAGRIPSSIDLMQSGQPFLPIIRGLPLGTDVTLHTIAGYAHHSPEGGGGDNVVPLSSALIDDAESQLLVPARHTNIYYQPQAIAEVRRILAEHAAINPVPGGAAQLERSVVSSPDLQRR